MVPHSRGNERLIIDGYNVLHAWGLLRGVGPGALERARNKLAGVLHRHLPESIRRRATIVFDSRTADATTTRAGEILVEFAGDHRSADERIIELIGRHSAPRQLLVVSSDHEIQKAARARRANFLDSDQWLEKLVGEKKSSRESNPEGLNLQPPVDVDYWMREFGLDDETADSAIVEEDADALSLNRDDAIFNPFPPGYLDDPIEEDN